MEVNESRWWPANTPRANHLAYACILWTLYLDGPFEHASGEAPSVLKRALIARDGPYTAAKGQPDLHYALERLADVDGPYRGCVERKTSATSCYRLALTIGVDELPPNPFERPDLYGSTQRSVSSSSADESALLDPLDALAAIKGLVDEALGHGLNAADFATAERLAAVLEENERLRVERDQIQSVLLEKLREVDGLRRALSTARRAR